MRSAFDPRPLAERIWNEVGHRPPFPRDVGEAMMDAFEAAVVVLPNLSIRTIDGWLHQRGRPGLGPRQDRTLHGCLLARSGRGLVFIDAGLCDGDHRFAVAHEFAHFYLHHLLPRRRAVERLGPSSLDVVDGRRSATTRETVSGVLRGVPIGPFEDFLSRGDGGRPNQKVIDIETEADLLACELLAPSAIIVRDADGDRVKAATIAQSFGLPEGMAEEWGHHAIGLNNRSDPLVLSMKRVLEKKR